MTLDKEPMKVSDGVYMNELIEENLLLKLTLLSMIRQFYNYKITHEEANEYNVQYDEEDVSDEFIVFYSNLLTIL